MWDSLVEGEGVSAADNTGGDDVSRPWRGSLEDLMSFRREQPFVLADRKAINLEALDVMVSVPEALEEMVKPLGATTTIEEVESSFRLHVGPVAVESEGRLYGC